mmetsp:Transcript_155328/g.286001  ORF Transcript_155328/g.286001 Transcript_155328/m.286001 type:complete len:84 (-) Transcript_155328:7-258(-)
MLAQGPNTHMQAKRILAGSRATTALCLSHLTPLRSLLGLLEFLIYAYRGTAYRTPAVKNRGFAVLNSSDLRVRHFARWTNALP